MSSHRGDLAFTNPPQENSSSPKKLVNSRWAPGGFEDQRIADQKIFYEQGPNGKETTPSAKRIHSSRWTTGPAERKQTQRKMEIDFNPKDHKINENESSNLNSKQRRRGIGARADKSSSTSKTTATPRRIIGPLSEEEMIVKMENPFFDPYKHKGLGSSRWANDDAPASSDTQTIATPRRIIGSLSEEENTFKMENPFFDPQKHKGLGSSRWANE